MYCNYYITAATHYTSRKPRLEPRLYRSGRYIRQFRANLPPPQFTPPVLHPSSPTYTPTVHLLRKLDALNTINNFKILNIKILISFCSNWMNCSFSYFYIFLQMYNTGMSHSFHFCMQEEINILMFNNLKLFIVFKTSSVLSSGSVRGTIEEWKTGGVNCGGGKLAQN